MKKVTLIGDSIRMHYQQAVIESLADVAEVWAPEVNSKSSTDILANLDEWVLTQPADVIHVNCGLHDLKREFDAGAPAIPQADYEANIRQILTRIQAGTSAILIWAATTPVNTEWHRKTKPFDRLDADVIAYNAAAAGIATELGLPVNDMYALVDAVGRDSWLSPDGVHFTDPARIEMGKAVAAFLRRYVTDA